jgi:hypothetical protein
VLLNVLQDLLRRIEEGQVPVMSHDLHGRVSGLSLLAARRIDNAGIEHVGPLHLIAYAQSSDFQLRLGQFVSPLVHYLLARPRPHAQQTAQATAHCARARAWEPDE